MIHQYSQNGGPGDIEDRFRAMAIAPGERLEELRALVLEMEAQGVAKLLNTGPDLSG